MVVAVEQVQVIELVSHVASEANYNERVAYQHSVFGSLLQLQVIFGFVLFDVVVDLHVKGVFDVLSEPS